MSSQSAADVKRADLASAAGALTAGLGLGMAIGSQPTWLAALVIVLGAVIHGWGMLNKHRLEARAGVALPRWTNALYWLCWIVMALGGLVLAVYAVG